MHWSRFAEEQPDLAALGQQRLGQQRLGGPGVVPTARTQLAPSALA